MIVADTNVWSETVKRTPDPSVVAWLLKHRHELAITTISIGELLFGLELMPDGRRKHALAAQLERLIASAAHHTYTYDAAAARHLARIRSQRRSSGREVATPEDAMIAAIAAAHGCSVATRNVNDFEGMGIEIIDPWNVGDT